MDKNISSNTKFIQIIMIVKSLIEQLKLIEQKEHNLTYFLMITTDRIERNPQTRE